MLRAAATNTGPGLTVADYAGIIAALLTAAGLWRGAWGIAMRSVGRRWDAARRLRRLGTGAQVHFFEAVLGEPPAIRARIAVEPQDPEAQILDEFDLCYWIADLYFVQSISTTDGTVVGFSITTRSRRFHPTLTFPIQATTREHLLERVTFGRRRFGRLATVELGRTRFEDVLSDREWTPAIRSATGARTWSYTEAYYLGNPGHYQSYAFTNSSVTAVGGFPDPVPGAVDFGDHPWTLPSDTDAPPERWLDHPPDWMREFRHNMPVTTVSVVSPMFDIEQWPTFGPHEDEVRTITRLV